MRHGVGAAVRLGLRGWGQAWAWGGATGPPVRAGVGGLALRRGREDRLRQLRKLAHAGERW